MEKIKLILITLSYALVFGGGYYISNRGQVPCPAPSLVASNEKSDQLKTHITGTIKKKDANPSTGAPAETEINFSADIDRLTAEKSQVVVTPQAQVKPDNVKFPINSKGEIGIDANLIGHHWLAYKYNLKDHENVYEYSYSTRIF